MAGGVPYELHACPWAQACAQFQQLQPTHHRFASHARKKPTRFNHVRNKLLSPPLAPDHGTSVNDVGGCGAESGSGGGRQALQLSWLVGQPGQSGTGAGFRSWRVSWESPAPAACLPQATGLGGLWCGEALSDGCRGVWVTVLFLCSLYVVFHSLHWAAASAVHTHEDSHHVPSPHHPCPLTHPTTPCTRPPV